jgi:phage-related protein
LPKKSVVFYCDEKSRAPFLDWFDELPQKAQDKCLVRIERLEELGHELKRPEADYLRDNIYELRFKHQMVNYRVLYFFHGRELVILSHGFAKHRSGVPDKEIITAIDRMNKFRTAPLKHTFME